MTEDTVKNTSSSLPKVDNKKLWYLNNFIILKDYYDRTISRISARCVRLGNIAIEDYEHFGYILDVLDEICVTGEFIIDHKELHPYVEKKIAGGMASLKKNLLEYKKELEANSSPDMIKEDPNELDVFRKALNDVGGNDTSKAGMSSDELMNKLMSEQKTDKSQYMKADNKLDAPKTEKKIIKKIKKVKQAAPKTEAPKEAPKETAGEE